jgi:hypothetical protein
MSHKTDFSQAERGEWFTNVQAFIVCRHVRGRNRHLSQGHQGCNDVSDEIVLLHDPENKTYIERDGESAAFAFPSDGVPLHDPTQ